jgi:hopanoid biosynthesis associated RND transporter like protein HpnN
LPYVRQGDARVRLTGQVVLDDEEFATVAQGAVAGLSGSFLLVMLWLFLAVRSWRLMLPVMVNLLFGLVVTTGFAAVVVGTLNLISVAFAVLFVGIAVDFAIQFTVRFRERRHTHPDLLEALRETGRRSGSQILVAALATAAGFLAFSPTHFIGVAQLGVIAGFGMLIAFASTLTLLPALLCLLHPRPPARAESRLRGLDPIVYRHRVAVVVVFAVLAACGAALAPKIPFDGDPLHTKNQNSESVRTLHDLMQDPITDPYTVQAVMPSLDAAVAAGVKYATLKQTQLVLTLASFLPTDQDAKLAAVRDVAALLAPTLTPPVTPPAVTVDGLRRSAAKLAASLDAVAPKLPADSPLRGIATSVRALARGPDANLLAANEALIRFLPKQLDRLRAALDVHRLTLADIPAELRDDWLLPDGQARVQALPSPDVKNGHAMRAWVKHALKVEPQSTGSAVYILKASDTITGAFKVAAYSALAAITLILAMALRRLPDVLLVLAPLTVSSLLTALLLRASGMSLNFANIIALPLLLGVGVSFNIYFVMNWRNGVTRFLATGTARAVVFSALTTSTAFGSLALSQHPGTASMGILLLMCLGCTVATTLVFLPALLSMVPRPHVVLGGR